MRHAPCLHINNWIQTPAGCSRAARRHRWCVATAHSTRKFLCYSFSKGSGGRADSVLFTRTLLLPSGRVRETSSPFVPHPGARLGLAGAKEIVEGNSSSCEFTRLERGCFASPLLILGVLVPQIHIERRARGSPLEALSNCSLWLSFPAGLPW